MSSKRLKYLFLILVSSILLIWEVGATEWERVTKPYKIGPISEISVGYDDQENQYIFAAGDQGSDTLWVTTNGGHDWDRSNSVSGYWHTRVVIQETDFEAGWTIVQGNSSSEAGPYRTTNGGDSWSRKAAGLSAPNALYALVADQGSSDLSTAFVGGEGTSENSYQRLLKWDNANQEWDLSQSGLPSNQTGIVNDIVINRLDSDYLVCAYEGNEDGPAVYFSDGGGANWEGLPIEYEDSEFVQSAIAVGSSVSDPYLIFVVEKSPVLGRIWKGVYNDYWERWDWTDVTVVDPFHYPPSCNMDCRSVENIRYPAPGGYNDLLFAAFNTRLDGEERFWSARLDEG